MYHVDDYYRGYCHREKGERIDNLLKVRRDDKNVRKLEAYRVSVLIEEELRKKCFE